MAKIARADLCNPNPSPIGLKWRGGALAGHEPPGLRNGAVCLQGPCALKSASSGIGFERGYRRVVVVGIPSTGNCHIGDMLPDITGMSDDENASWLGLTGNSQAGLALCRGCAQRQGRAFSIVEGYLLGGPSLWGRE